MSVPSFDDAVVLSFESRREKEIAELIRRHGGRPLSAPSMREIPLEENESLGPFVSALTAGDLDLMLLLTGVGTRALVEAASAKIPRTELLAHLGQTILVVRGPKPAAVLREFGLQAAVRVPEPNTWREILATLDRAAELEGRTIAVQEYGVTNPELLQGLEERGAEVLRVPIYRWALPLDLAPMRHALTELAAGRVAVTLFTSATQVEHVVGLAEDLETLQQHLAATTIVSIGPICTEALLRHGITPSFEPIHPKMGHLVREAAQRTHRGDEAPARS